MKSYEGWRTWDGVFDEQDLSAEDNVRMFEILRGSFMGDNNYLRSLDGADRSGED